MEADFLEPAQGTSTHEIAIAEYHASRARYIRTMTSDLEKRLSESVAKRRQPLIEEIENLTVLAHYRYEAYQTALKAYAIKAPGRVTSTGIVSPTPADRMIPGIEKAYKAAVGAAAEFTECNEIIKKRKAKLADMDWKMRTQVEQLGRDLIRQLESTRGLEIAFQRDPLLMQAHKRMLAAQPRPAA